jgi:hypothetical protein
MRRRCTSAAMPASRCASSGRRCGSTAEKRRDR